jgi:hypothetical protein
MNCHAFRIALKAAERRRTPRRKREINAYNGGHVLECGAAAPLSMHMRAKS